MNIRYNFSGLVPRSFCDKEKDLASRIVELIYWKDIQYRKRPSLDKLYERNGNQKLKNVDYDIIFHPEENCAMDYDVNRECVRIDHEYYKEIYANKFYAAYHAARFYGNYLFSKLPMMLPYAAAYNVPSPDDYMDLDSARLNAFAWELVMPTKLIEILLVDRVHAKTISNRYDIPFDCCKALINEHIRQIIYADKISLTGIN